MFADINPGTWGSYPLNLTPSGSTLFFSADNGHGYELYATDGTAGSVHVVKDIKPGLGGSNPAEFISAGNGVVYFTADDGTGRALWRSDGTAAGTAKVPGMPAGPSSAPYGASPTWNELGFGGKLYFATTSPQSGNWQVWVTDGGSPTLLKEFGGGAGGSVYLNVVQNRVLITVSSGDGSNQCSCWTTDGTPAGTNLWQSSQATANGSSLGVELASGRFVSAASGALITSTATIALSNGVDGSSLKVLKTFDTSADHAIISSTLVLLGGKAYFTVQSADPAINGLWATDGTTAGTTHLNLTGGVAPDGNTLEVFDGRLLVRGLDRQTNQVRWWLTDGTSGGTTEVVKPAGVTGTLFYLGQTLPDSAATHGMLLFTDDPSGNGRLFETDGTPSGWRQVDAAGLPQALSKMAIRLQPTGTGAATGIDQSAVYFNGAVYFSSGTSTQKPELWKWDVATPATPPVVPPPPVAPPVVPPAPAVPPAVPPVVPPTVPPPATVVAPQVTSVVVNGGAAQRSMVTELTVTFSRQVELEDGAVSLKDANGRAILLYLNSTTVNGATVLTITFGGTGVVGGSLPDGRFTLTVKAGKVHDVATGGVMEHDSTAAFTRLFGDLTGDGVFDRDARWMVSAARGRTVGQPGYVAALDVNRDGVIDATDELAVVRNWGKSV